MLVPRRVHNLVDSHGAPEIHADPRVFHIHRGVEEGQGVFIEHPVLISILGFQRIVHPVRADNDARPAFVLIPKL